MKKFFLTILFSFFFTAAFAQEGDFDVEKILNSIKEDNKNVQNYVDLGRAYLYKQDYLRAINSFEYAIFLGCAEGDVYNYLGMAYYKRGNIKKALENFENAFLADENNYIYMNNLAICYKSLNDTKKYEEIMAKMQVTNPITKDEYVQLVKILYTKKDIEGAKVLLNQAIKKYPKDPFLKELFNKLNKS